MATSECFIYNTAIYPRNEADTDGEQENAQKNDQSPRLHASREGNDRIRIEGGDQEIGGARLESSVEEVVKAALEIASKCVLDARVDAAVGGDGAVSA